MKPFGRLTIPKDATPIFKDYLLKWYDIKEDDENTYLIASHISNDKKVYHIHFFVNLTSEEEYNKMRDRFQDTKFKQKIQMKGRSKWDLQVSKEEDKSLTYIWNGHLYSKENDETLDYYTNYDTNHLFKLVQQYREQPQQQKTKTKTDIKNILTNPIHEDVEKELRTMFMEETYKSYLEDRGIQLIFDFNGFHWEHPFKILLEYVLIVIGDKVQKKYRKKIRYKLLSEIILDSIIFIEEINEDIKKGLSIIRARTIISNITFI